MANTATPIVVNVDGACSGNPGPGGWAVVIQPTSPGGTPTTAHGHGGADTTNQAMELMAVRRALEVLVENGLKGPVTIRGDSQYVVKGIREWLPGWRSNGWRTAGGKRVANLEAWKAVDGLVRGRDVRVEWVRGHAGDRWNEMADQLAVAGSRNPRLGRSGRIVLGSDLAAQIEGHASLPQTAAERVAAAGGAGLALPDPPPATVLVELGPRTAAIREEAERLMAQSVNFATARAARQGVGVGRDGVAAAAREASEAAPLLRGGIGGAVPTPAEREAGKLASAAFHMIVEPGTVQAILDHEAALGRMRIPNDDRVVALVTLRDIAQAASGGPRTPVAAFVAANAAAVSQDGYAMVGGFPVRTGTLRGPEGIASLARGFGPGATRRLAFDAGEVSRIALDAEPGEAAKAAAAVVAASRMHVERSAVGKERGVAPSMAKHNTGWGAGR